jgi:photosystem II stability/assembly factor-like uncharacterized protein
MKLRHLAQNCWGLLLVSALLTTVIGCHGEHEWPPLSEQKIYVADKFFDVAVLDEKSAIVIGYGGKMISTENAGFAWELVDTGTSKSLYSIDFAPGGQVGWLVGESGLILRTTDGGKTWSQQETELWLDKECADEEEMKYRDENEPCLYAYLFAVSVVDENTAHIIGDKSIYTRTTDGGKTWNTQTITLESDISDDLKLAFEDPVLYDVEFLDADNGYIVGEFGKIYHTTDGGETFTEQQESVMDESVIDILDLPTMFDVEFYDENNGMIVGLDGRVAVTTDGGEDWNFVPHHEDDYVDPFYSAAILSNGQRWAVGASGQVVHSAAGDSDFSRGDLGSRVTTWMRRIRFHDDKHGWIVGGFGLIMYTDDGGETWFRRLG